MCTGSAIGQEQTENSYVDVPFGTYGYLHHYLHSYGTIEDLLNKANKNCCDGGEGGECRATELSFDGRFFLYGNQWCPLSVWNVILYNVDMPHDVQAVVCAPASALDVCPTASYCVAGRVTG
jgi:hypothetical protein